MIYKKYLTAIALISMMFLLQCVSARIYQTYEGNKKSSNEVAVITLDLDQDKTNMVQVDGQESQYLNDTSLYFTGILVQSIFTPVRYKANANIEVLPGKHSFLFKCEDENNMYQLSFQAEAGKTYQINSALDVIDLSDKSKVQKDVVKNSSFMHELKITNLYPDTSKSSIIRCGDNDNASLRRSSFFYAYMVDGKYVKFEKKLVESWMMSGLDPYLLQIKPGEHTISFLVRVRRGIWPYNSNGFTTITIKHNFEADKTYQIEETKVIDIDNKDNGNYRIITEASCIKLKIVE